MQMQLEGGYPQGSVRTRREKSVRREQAFKVEMAASVEGFDGDRAFVGNHWPDEISCHVIINSVIVLLELCGSWLKRGSVIFPFDVRHCTRMHVWYLIFRSPEL